MRVLVLGGTSFLSKEVAGNALRRGHEVVCAARGRTGAAPDGARLVVVDRDEPGGVEVLAGEKFDAVVDVATALGWVHDALTVLVPGAGHWTFVSTINVYADTATMRQTAGADLLEPATTTDRLERADMTPEIYGGIKVASENVVRDATGDRAFLVRPGLITGPGDYMDRFGYWPARFSRGGRVVVPDTPQQPIQHIDVRDLAAWIVTAGEQRLTGAYDAVGPVLELGPMLRDIAELVAAEGTELVPTSPDKLIAAAVNPWSGPRSLPLWLPRSHYGLASHDATSAWAAGLQCRPLSETVEAALADERARGLDRPRTAGLTAEEEIALLS
ncbi:MAG: epimerase [Actinomycetota bacterium]|nr:epimerase [Actinomycetota bacterium]